MRLFFALVGLSIPLFSQTCDFTVTPTALSVPSSASNGVINVITSADCGWTAASDVSWLKVVAGTPGNGSGAVSYTVDANVTELQRTGTLTVAGKRVSVTQAGAQCSYNIDPKSATPGAFASNGSFKVTTGCIWYPQTTRGDFLTLPGVDPNNPYRVGDSTVNYSLTANPCAYPRSGSIIIYNTSATVQPAFAVTQDGAPGNLTTSPASVNAGPDAADGRIVVTTGNGCGWSAASDVSWLQIINGGGAGNGAITYHLLANTIAARTGNILIGNLRITVTQAGPGPSTPSIAAVESAANYKADAVSPGEILVLFGSNMGPATLVPLQVKDNAITSILAGTQVLFDGAPAPLIYTRADQVSAIAPYSLAGKSTTQVQVNYNGVPSATVAMPVQPSHPGIFSQDSTGLGPGAILNQDTSTNTGVNPAARGSIVSIYATGGGTTDPALSDGAVTGADLPYLKLPVTVNIGGLDARVTYAGGVPGAVAGLTQINAEIPASVTPGSSVPVIITIGGVRSTAGVTVAVK